MGISCDKRTSRTFIPDQDKPNFTDLVIQLRKQLGKTKLITFAAGGFGDFFEKSIEWQKVNPYLDFVNLMSYDLVHGYSTETGHQSALYSNRSQDESIDRAVNFFRKYKFPLSKVVVGVPFYTRYFQVEDTSDNGLFKAAKFVSGKDYKTIKILWNPMALWLIGIRQHRCLTGSMQRKSFCYRR